MSSDERIPVACSLDAEGMEARRAEAAELLRAGLLERRELDEGLQLRFRGGPELRASVRNLVRREKECCPFLDFRLDDSGEELAVAVTGPPEARPILEGLFAPA